MKAYFRIIALIVVSLSSFALFNGLGRAQGSAEAHIVIDISGGQAFISRASWSNIDAHQSLSVGDMVGDDDLIYPIGPASITIRCANDRTVVIATIISPSCEPISQQDVTSGVFELPSGSKGSDLSSIILHPRGRILENRPLFRWTPVDGTATYRLEIRGGSSTLLWIEDDIVENETTYPTERPSLDPGEYTVTVRPIDATGVALEIGNRPILLVAPLVIPREDEVAQLNQEISLLQADLAPPILEYLKARIYARHRYFSAAIETMQGVLGTNLIQNQSFPIPEMQDLSAMGLLMIGDWYYRMDVQELSYRAYEAAFVAAKATGKVEAEAWLRVLLAPRISDRRERYCFIQPAIAFFVSVGEKGNIASVAVRLSEESSRQFDSQIECSQTTTGRYHLWSDRLHW